MHHFTYQQTDREYYREQHRDEWLAGMMPKQEEEMFSERTNVREFQKAPSPANLKRSQIRSANDAMEECVDSIGTCNVEEE
jgi:hypothetical protein